MRWDLIYLKWKGKCHCKLFHVLSVTCFCFDIRLSIRGGDLEQSASLPRQINVYTKFTALNVEFSVKVSLCASNTYQLWKHPPHYKATIISFTSRHPLVINHSDSVAKVAYQNQNNRALSLYCQMNYVHCSGVWNSINWVRTKFKRQPMSVSVCVYQQKHWPKTPTLSIAFAHTHVNRVCLLTWHSCFSNGSNNNNNNNNNA